MGADVPLGPKPEIDVPHPGCAPWRTRAEVPTLHDVPLPRPGERYLNLSEQRPLTGKVVRLRPEDPEVVPGEAVRDVDVLAVAPVEREERPPEGEAGESPPPLPFQVESPDVVVGLR